MNIYYGPNQIDSKRDLNESQNIDISSTEFAELNSTNELYSMVENYQKLFKNESNLFKFSNGSKMAKIDANIDVNSRFSIRWHADNTTDIDDFLNSISRFIKGKLTNSEISQLTKMYNQLYPEF